MNQSKVQMTKSLIDTKRRGLEAKIAEVEARAERERRARTGTGTAKPLKIDGTTSLALFRRQFETGAEHNYWMWQEKPTNFITALQWCATDVLH
jgi:hypothetical protein